MQDAVLASHFSVKRYLGVWYQELVSKLEHLLGVDDADTVDVSELTEQIPGETIERVGTLSKSDAVTSRMFLETLLLTLELLAFA